jgi:hypothetical protein
VAAFYIDDGIALALAPALFRLGHFATTSQDEGRKGANDEVHLWLAAQQGWTLVTPNGQDFRMLHRAWQLWGVPSSHAGILVIAQVPTVLANQAATAIDDLVRQGQPLPNRLYQQVPRGWTSYP